MYENNQHYKRMNIISVLINILTGILLYYYILFRYSIYLQYYSCSFQTAIHIFGRDCNQYIILYHWTYFYIFKSSVYSQEGIYCNKTGSLCQDLINQNVSDK